MAISDQPLAEAFISATLTSMIRSEPFQEVLQSMRPRPLVEGSSSLVQSLTSFLPGMSYFEEVDDVENEQASNSPTQTPQEIFCALLRETLIEKFASIPCLKNSNSETFARLLRELLPKGVTLPEEALLLLDGLFLSIETERQKQSIPQCGVVEEELEPDDSSIIKSSNNKVRKAYITQNDKRELVFYKPCSDKYSPHLAKHAVTASIFYRSVLGNRSAKESLVFNKQGQIIGTISFAIPGFNPLSSESASKLTTEDLVELESADVLISMWRLKEDDGHPDNLGIALIDGKEVLVKIDNDMALYDEGHLEKGQRITHYLIQEGPYEATEIHPEHLNTCPNKMGDRTHNPVQEPKTKHPGKYFLCKDAFVALEHNERFRAQKNSTLLFQLLSFQTSVVQTELQRHLGDLPYGFNERSEYQRYELMRLFGRHYFFDQEDGRELTYAEHMDVYGEISYQRFYRIVTEDKEFLNYLLETQKGLYKQLQLFQNLKNSCPEFTLSVRKIEEHFDKILNDALYAQVCRFLNRLSEQLPAVQRDLIGEETTPNPLETPLIPSRNRTPCSNQENAKKTSSHSFTYPANKESLYLRLIHLFRELKSEATAFFSENNYSDTKRQAFFSSLQSKIESFDSSLLANEAPTTYGQIEKWKIDSIKFCQKVRHSGVHLRSDLQLFTEGRKIERQRSSSKLLSSSCLFRAKPKRKVRPSEMSERLKDALKKWLSKKKFTEIQNLVQNKAIEKYTPTLKRTVLSVLNVRNLWDNRENEIIKHVESAFRVFGQRKATSSSTGSLPQRHRVKSSRMDEPRTERDAEAVAHLLKKIYSNTDGGWYANSYNFILLKCMVTELLADRRRDIADIDAEGLEDVGESVFIEESSPQSNTHPPKKTKDSRQLAGLPPLNTASKANTPEDLRNYLMKDKSSIDDNKLLSLIDAPRQWLEEIIASDIKTHSSPVINEASRQRTASLAL